MNLSFAKRIFKEWALPFSILLIIFIINLFLINNLTSITGAATFRLQVIHEWHNNWLKLTEHSQLPLGFLLYSPLVKWCAPMSLLFVCRLLAISIGTIALLQYYRLVLYVFSPLIAISSLIIFALFPANVFHSTMPTELTLYQFLFFSGLLYTYLFYKKNSLKYYYTTIILLILAGLTRYEVWPIIVLLLWQLRCNLSEKNKHHQVALLLPIASSLCWALITNSFHERIFTIPVFNIPSSWIDRLMLWPNIFREAVGIIGIVLALIGVIRAFHTKKIFSLPLIVLVCFLIFGTMLGLVEGNNRYVLIPLALMIPFCFSSLRHLHRLTPVLVIIFPIYLLAINSSSQIAPTNPTLLNPMLEYLTKRYALDQRCNLLIDGSSGHAYGLHQLLAHLGCFATQSTFLFLDEGATQTSAKETIKDREYSLIILQAAPRPSLLGKMINSQGQLCFSPNLRYEKIKLFDNYQLYQKQTISE